MKKTKLILTEARKAEYDRAYKAACEMYNCSVSMLELAAISAEDYDLTEQEMREVILTPILLFISSRKGLSDKEKKVLMREMISQVCVMYEQIIGPLDDEEDEEED